MERYEEQFPEAIRCLEEGLEDSLQFYRFDRIDHRKISSTNTLERLNREIRRRSKVVGIFPNKASYVRLITTYLMEYEEEWESTRAYVSVQSFLTLGLAERKISQKGRIASPNEVFTGKMRK